MRYLTLLALLAATPAFAQNARILPQNPIVEPVETGQDINFDIVVKNDGAEPLELESLQVHYLDAAGKELWRRNVDGNGSAPNIELLGNRKIAPGEARLYFNPYPHLPAAFPVRQVEVRLTFGGDGGENTKRELIARSNMSTRKPASLLFPLAGRIWVWDGHDESSHHRRWNHAIPYIRGLGFASNGMRYSWDFVLDGAVSLGAPVRSVADGTVVSLVSDQNDDRSFDPEASRQNINALFGNYIVIDLGNDTFALYGHVQKDSITVNVGDRVRRGQHIANVGQSGSSLLPHLHFQLMDGPDMHAEGVPALFRDFTRVRGMVRERVRLGAIASSDLIEVR
jgi:murein DD-endopeptidase MepM/ murein hydrolase activator NlpD